jgi:hypothetical protein
MAIGFLIFVTFVPAEQTHPMNDSPNSKVATISPDMAQLRPPSSTAASRSDT